MACRLNPDYIKAYLMLSNTMANGTTMFRRKFIEKYNISYKDNVYGEVVTMCRRRFADKVAKAFYLWEN